MASARNQYSWRYYRPANTGIQGDWCDALWISPNGDPWIGGYNPSFEEGGIAKFIQAENRWLNVSNVDYPEIGHPEKTGISRVSDMDVDSKGRIWMATGRGALFYDPAIGPTSLKRFDGDNSPIPGGWNKGVEIAPDGTVWFSSYSTNWGGGGIAKYNPVTKKWTVFEGYGGGSLSIQPLQGGQYYVWTMLGNESAKFSSVSNSWTVYPIVDNNPALTIGKNSTDSAGNTWMYRWTNASMFEMAIGLRRPDGTWANIPPAPFDVQFNNARSIRATGPNQAVMVDGGGTVYKFDGVAWTNLGIWNQTTQTEDVDIDSQGNIWACGSGGAAKRDAATGAWQRYRITNTSQFGLFNNDLTIAPDGGVYSCANAAPGYGGMVRFDGVRWTGFNDFQYGLGKPWPFPTDDSRRVYARQSNGNVVVNPMFNGLHNYDGSSWLNLQIPNDSVDDVVEDSLGRLWISYYAGIAVSSGANWNVVSDTVGGKLYRDPKVTGAVWAMGQGTIMRTDGISTYTRSISDFPELDPLTDQFGSMAVDRNGLVWIGTNSLTGPNLCSLIRLNPESGAYTIYREQAGRSYPGETLMVLGTSPDGRVWMQYDSDFLTAKRGLFWFDGMKMGQFPAPPFGDPQWGGLPHAGILDFEVKTNLGGYELWMSCASRGIAVLKVRSK